MEVNKLEIRHALIEARGQRTQEEVALEVGVSQQTISHWENGRATPPIRKMIKLEKMLSTPKEILFPDVFNSINEYFPDQDPTGTEG